MVSNEEMMIKKLDMIAEYLRLMDARDRRRSVGAAIKTLLSISYFALFVGSTWYVIAHGPELMQTITEQTIKSTMSASTGGTDMNALYQQVKDAMSGGNKDGDIRVK